MGRITYIFVALMCVMAVGYSSDSTLYQRNGHSKPIIAVMPVIDHSETKGLNWELSHEFTTEILSRIFDSHKLYLLREESSFELAVRLNTVNPMHLPMKLPERYGSAEYVLVTEVIEHCCTPELGCITQEKIGSASLALRVRVIHMRHDHPEVILQEIVSHDQAIARPYLMCDYKKNAWGTKAFEHTPLGQMHRKAISEVVARVENYVGAQRG